MNRTTPKNEHIDGETVTVRFPADLLRLVDQFAEQDRRTRSSAIRRLAEIGLGKIGEGK